MWNQEHIAALIYFKTCCTLSLPLKNMALYWPILPTGHYVGLSVWLKSMKFEHNLKDKTSYRNLKEVSIKKLDIQFKFHVKNVALR